MEYSKKLLSLFRLSLITSFLFLFFNFNISPALAFIESSTGEISMTAGVNPPDPAPDSPTTITIHSFESDLDRAIIEWRLNGQTQNSGIGQTSFSFTTGVIGSRDIVTATVLVGSITSTKTLIFDNGVVDFIWEPETYTPIFYQGKALISSESIVRLAAFPSMYSISGKLIPFSQLVYKWKRNGRNVPAASGYGKNIYTFKTADRDEDIISVNVIGPDGSSIERAITIPVTSPNILFYQRRPLEGTDYDHAYRGQLSTKDSDITLLTAPYNFSNPVNALKIYWTQNGKSFTPTNPLVTVFRRDKDSDIESNIGVTIQDSDRLFQRANASLKIVSSPR